MSEFDLKALWQHEETNPPLRFDLDAVKRRAQQFEAKVRRRNALEWIAAAFVFVWFGGDALGSETMGLMVGNAIIALAAVGLSFYLWRHGRIQGEADPSLDACAFVAAQAQNLERQAHLLAQAPLWYVSPLALGVLVLHAARIPPGGRALLVWSLVGSFFVLVFAGVTWMNRRGAKRLRAEAARIRVESAV